MVIFSVGIGQNINMEELRTMASQPKEQRVILLNNFYELTTLAKRMSYETCNGKYVCTYWLISNYDRSVKGELDARMQSKIYTG